MNVKRMEVMVEDLSESFDRHIAMSQESYHFVIPAEDGAGRLSLRLYSSGGETQLELLAFAAGSAQPSFTVKVDGETVDERIGAITIAQLPLAKGWRTVEVTAQGISCGKVRITGSISNASIL